MSQERILTYAEAMQEAAVQAMREDDKVVVFGQGIHDHKGFYGTTLGLEQEFGSQRVFDTPISEDGMTGAAIGMAMAGLRPIHTHIRMDFGLLAMNQLINIAAKSHYMYGGQVNVPMVVRMVIGRSWGQGAQHSQGLHSFFMHVPGLKVVAPTTPYDAKGCLLAAIRDPNPVIVVEHRMIHFQKGHVPAEAYEVPFGQARVLRPGKDLTIVAISYMAVEALRAAELLAGVGIDAEVIDPVSLAPLDVDSITASVAKTGRLLALDCAWTMAGASAEILAAVQERIGGDRPLKMKRMGYAPVPCPTTKSLENAYYPSAAKVASVAHALVRGQGSFWMPREDEAPEVVQFKGPF